MGEFKERRVQGEESSRRGEFKERRVQGEESSRRGEDVKKGGRRKEKEQEESGGLRGRVKSRWIMRGDHQ